MAGKTKSTFKKISPVLLIGGAALVAFAVFGFGSKKAEARQEGRTERVTERWTAIPQIFETIQGGRTERVEFRQGGHTERVELRQETKKEIKLGKAEERTEKN